jgi:hypothetical protein
VVAGTGQAIVFIVSILAGMAGGGLAAVFAPVLVISDLNGHMYDAAFNRCAFGAALGAVPGFAFGLSAWWVCGRWSDQGGRLAVQITAVILAFCGAAALVGWAMIQLLLWALASV